LVLWGIEWALTGYDKMYSHDYFPKKVFTMIVNSLDRESILSELSSLKEDLTTRYDVNKIGVFGSIARNEANENSDIDIVVDMQPNILKRVNLKIELEERFGRKVDVIRYWYGMNKYLKARIDREAVYA
jgi:predicted nucleotidyltransferase